MDIVTSCFGLTTPPFGLRGGCLNSTGKNTRKLADGRRNISVMSSLAVAGSRTPSQRSIPILAPRRDRTKSKPEPSLSPRYLFHRLVRILLCDVIVHQLLERGGKLIVSAFERNVLFPVDVHRAARRFASARQADANVGSFGFARAIDDATHHREGHFFDAFVLRFPTGHHVPDVALDALGQFLERSA